MGDGSTGKVTINSFKAERTSFLPEPSPISGYSAIQNQPGNDKQQQQHESCFYSCCRWIKTELFSPPVKAEAKAVIRLAFGIYANTFFGFFIPLSMTFIVGQKGKAALAAAGLGWSICNVTGHVYVIGVTSVCETFFSQAYGAKQMRRYGIILQRAFILTCIAILPSCAVWINMDKLLLLLGQDREVAMLAGQFALWYIPGIFFFVVFNLLLRYLACQSIVYPSIYSAFAAFIVNGICCYVFVHVCDLGVRGGALAVDVAFLVYCAVLVFFIFWKKLYKETWYGLSYDCLCDWKEFITLSASSIVLSISEWVCFEVGIIALGIVGSMEQAVQILLYGIAGMMYFVSLSFSIVAAVRVGNFIGSGDPERAKISAKVCLKLAILGSTCTGLLLYGLHDYIVYVFTSERSVIENASKLIYLIVVISIFDSLEVVSMGVVRGLGYQRFGALINFLSFLCLGTLSYMLLVFKAHLGVRGYWYGVSIGIFVETVALFVLLYMINWKKLSQSVRENVGVAVNSESDDHRSIADDNRDETETINLKIKSYNSVEFHVDDDQNEDVCLITETNLSYSGNHGDYTKQESADHSKATQNTVPHSDKVNDCDVFFVYERPQFTKLDIFIKVSAISVLLLGVVASAVVRFYL